jgi:hypothetical protein
MSTGIQEEMIEAREATPEEDELLNWAEGVVKGGYEMVTDRLIHAPGDAVSFGLPRAGLE